LRSFCLRPSVCFKTAASESKNFSVRTQSMVEKESLMSIAARWVHTDLRAAIYDRLYLPSYDLYSSLFLHCID
jgi:hypothetical protein